MSHGHCQGLSPGGISGHGVGSPLASDSEDEKELPGHCLGPTGALYSTQVIPESDPEEPDVSPDVGKTRKRHRALDWGHLTDVATLPCPQPDVQGEAKRYRFGPPTDPNPDPVREAQSSGSAVEAETPNPDVGGVRNGCQLLTVDSDTDVEEPEALPDVGCPRKIRKTTQTEPRAPVVAETPNPDVVGARNVCGDSDTDVEEAQSPNPDVEGPINAPVGLLVDSDTDTEQLEDFPDVSCYPWIRRMAPTEPRAPNVMLETPNPDVGGTRNGCQGLSEDSDTDVEELETIPDVGPPPRIHRTTSNQARAQEGELEPPNPDVLPNTQHQVPAVEAAAAVKGSGATPDVGGITGCIGALAEQDMVAPLLPTSPHPAVARTPSLEGADGSNPEEVAPTPDIGRPQSWLRFQNPPGPDVKDPDVASSASPALDPVCTTGSGGSRATTPTMGDTRGIMESDSDSDSKEDPDLFLEPTQNFLPASTGDMTSHWDPEEPTQPFCPHQEEEEEEKEQPPSLEPSRDTPSPTVDLTEPTLNPLEPPRDTPTPPVDLTEPTLNPPKLPQDISIPNLNPPDLPQNLPEPPLNPSEPLQDTPTPPLNPSECFQVPPEPPVNPPEPPVSPPEPQASPDPPIPGPTAAPNKDEGSRELPRSKHLAQSRRGRARGGRASAVGRASLVSAPLRRSPRLQAQAQPPPPAEPIGAMGRRQSRPRPRQTTPAQPEAQEEEEEPVEAAGVQLRPRWGCGSTPPKVLFTGVVATPAMEVALQTLGGSVATSVFDCSHLVTDRVRRTIKFLCAVARGIPIVTPQWLHKSASRGRVLPPGPFLPQDPQQELLWGFSLAQALQRSRCHPLLQGYEVHVTPNVHPAPQHMKDIIACSGGTFLPTIPHSYRPRCLVISCEEDSGCWAPALAARLPLASSELLLTGLLRQQLQLQTFLLRGDPPPETSNKHPPHHPISRWRQRQHPPPQ